MEKQDKEREDLRPYMKEAKKYAWITIGYLLFDATLLFIAMQSSQAMKAAWFEDLLFFIPSLSFLIGSHFVSRPPNKRFRFGYDRAYTIGYITASIALLGIGSYLLIESLLKLIHQDILTIGSVFIFGQTIWFGWIMIAAVGYSIIPVYLLGQKKLKLARKLNIQILEADAKGQKADWLTSVATIAGVVGIGFGLWWADAVAAIIIAGDILFDGIRNIKAAIAEAMDRSPLDVELKEDPLTEQVEQLVKEEDWVEDFLVRLRKSGNKTSGEILLIPKDQIELVEKTTRLARKAESLSWRITQIVVAPVQELPLLYEKKL